MSLELGARLESAGELCGGGSRRSAFDASVLVSWGELTSSKLKAQSYDEAGTRDAFDCSALVSRGGLTSSKLLGKR